MPLIPRPDLDIRNEEQLAAEAISRVSGGLSISIAQSRIKILQELIKQIEGGSLPSPICPELTNANPSAPHTVIIEAIAWMLAQMAYRINQVPDQNLIEFARLHGITLKPATNAETTLQFTVTLPEGLNTDVTIPEGTQVATADESQVFLTNVALVIPSGNETGDVLAHRTVTGHTLLAPNVLTNLLDTIAYVTAVTNQDTVDSGTEEETIESALERARQYQRRSERIVTTQDLEEAILNEALDGNGVVRAFPFVQNGDFDSSKVGHTTVIVMTTSGDPVGDEVRQKIALLLGQVIGNQYVYLFDPVYKNFNVAFAVKLRTGANQDAVVAAIEKNIRDFYAPNNEHFGRDIVRSEIIALIEATQGVDRIIANPDGRILKLPSADLHTKVWEIPRPVNFTIDVP